MTFLASLQVMKHESTNTTLKQGRKMHNDCQFSKTKKVPFVQIKCKNNVDNYLNIRGTVHHEFVSAGQTVKQVYYLKVLERLREEV
jgi:uncharacterized protein (DUF1015 family)